MSFRGRGDAGGNPNKMELGEPRKFGGPDGDKSSRDDNDRFDSGRGRPGGRPGFGRGGRPSPGRDKPFNDRSRDFGYGRDEQMMRDRSPLRGPEDRFSDRFRKEDSFSKRDDHGRKDSGRPFYGDDSPRDRFMDSRSRHEGGGGPGSYGSSRFDAPSSMQFKPRPANFPNPANKDYYSEGFPRPNECEIIVVNKQQRAYSESVEDRVKSLGILVDILFLKDEALLTQTIDDIARRGSLYAMVIGPQNETHRSITVNILHGTPQEHRNMPLEDALKLLSRNFHEHIRSQRERMDRERAERGQYVGVVADREMQFLLRMLADGRWISLAEINLVVRYLCERRDKMQASPGDERGGRMPPTDVKMDPPFKPKDDPDVSQKEQDLQNRIINLMNQGAPPAGTGSGQPVGLSQGLHSEMDLPPPSRQNPPSMGPNMGNVRPQAGMGTGMKSGGPGLEDNQTGPPGLNSSTQNKDPVNKPTFSSVSSTLPSDPASTATYINFDNPSVQKALDNLMQSGPNLLKNISLSTSAVTNTPSNQPSAAAADRGDSSGINAPDDHLMPRGNMGPRGSDMGNPPPRNAGNLDMMGSRGPMGDMGGPGGPRSGGNMLGMSGGMGGGMGSGRGGYGNMPDMGQMNNPRGFGSSGGGGMSDMGRMGPPRGAMGGPQGQDRGPPQGMGQGGNFPNQNQYNKYQGPGQQGNFPGAYNSGPNMGGMSRQNYGGPQGMGGMGSAPRRY